LRRAVEAFLGNRVSTDDWLQGGLLVSGAAIALWDVDCWSVLSDLHLDFARASGALAPLSAALNARRMLATFCGDFEAATSLGVEEIAVKEATGARKGSYGALLLAAYYGRPAETLPLIAANADDAIARGEGLGLQHANWASAVLNNGLGRYPDALPAAEQAAEEDYTPFITACALPELVEAAVRSGQPAVATIALTRLSTRTGTGATGSDWAAGMWARSRALLSEGEIAESGYVEAVDRLARTPLRPDLARAHLLYGEWLRRQARRVDARHQLRAAYDLFAAMGAQAFAERARTELQATGEKVRNAKPDPHAALTPQEQHIARLARTGRTNAEIGGEMFLSARTVEWHLRKIYTKLGITSRKELMAARQDEHPVEEWHLLQR
jgi:DNA-binding CsgD family transcriptional regulator